MPRPNILEFQKSINRELVLTKDRVEFLIGSANWGDVGRYKESILKKVIVQFLPSNLKIGTGFIVGNNDILYGREGRVSKQLDIIIYEEKFPVIFREGDFVIVTESAVKAVIEVKTRIINYSNPRATGHDNAFNKIVNKMNNLNDFQSFRLNGPYNPKFVGIFSYEYDGDYSSALIDDALKISNGLVNHISLGPNFFVKHWQTTVGLELPPDKLGRCYIKYDLVDLSFSYFISNLLHTVADENPIERSWFSFPIEGTKETMRASINPVVSLSEL